MRILGVTLIALAVIGFAATLLAFPVLKGWTALCLVGVGSLILTGTHVLED